MAAPPDPNVGKVLQGRYRIVEHLASGGMGTVYRGERVELGRAVAIKFVWPAVARDEAMLKRFEIEAQAMSRLTHPSCVGVIDFGVEDGAPYMVMDFAAGRTLAAVIDEGRLPVDQALHIARQILGGLAHAHAQGIVHRDIKPQNIVLSEMEGFGTQARILDFGLAKLKDRASNLTTGFAVGTPSYMSPEQTCGDPVDARSDLYSVGVLLFQMITGRVPFVADQVQQVFAMHRDAPRPTLRQAAGGAVFSRELEAVIAQAMGRLPAERFTSAAELARALDATPEAKGQAAVASEAAEPIAPPNGRPTRPLRAVASPSPSASPLPSESASSLPSASASPLPSALPSPSTSRRWVPVAMATVLLAGGGAWWWSASTRDAAAPATSAASPHIEASTAQASAGRPTPPSAADKAGDPGLGRDTVPGLEQAEAWLREGRTTAAVEALRKLRKKYPDDAGVAYAIGNIYFARMWWSDGFDAYRTAVTRDPAYRTDAVLIRNVLKSLVSDRYGSIGARFIQREIGAAAVPYVEEIAHSRSLGMSTRAQRLLTSLRK